MKRIIVYLIILLVVQCLYTSVIAQGIISTFAGTGVAGYSGDGGAATDAELSIPNGICADALGDIYIADYRNNVIRKISATTGVISTFAGTGISGFSGDGGAATNAKFSGNMDVRSDSSGNIYIADYYNQRIRKVTVSTGIVSTVAGTGVSGYSGDGGPATNAQLAEPSGIYVDKPGNIYIAEFGNHTIRKVTAATGIISTVAGTGISGFFGDAGPATTAKLYQPNGVFVDDNMNIYIADTKNQRIRKVTASTGVINTIAGTGSYGYAGDGALAIDATFFNPIAIYIDQFSDLYIADVSNYVVRKITASTGIITTIAGTGVSGFSGDGGPATSAKLNLPSGIIIDKSGYLYIVDAENNRIRVIDNTKLGVPLEEVSEERVVYPNPCTDFISISNLNKTDHLFLYDINGKMVSNQWTINPSLEIQKFNVSNISPGEYIFQVFNKNNVKISSIPIIKY